MNLTAFQFVGLVQGRLNQRGANLTLDSIPGPRTVAALDQILPDLPTPLPRPAVNLATASTSAKHYDLAKQYLGIKEQPGAGTHPKLKPMFDLTPSWLDQDDSVTAWCGIFRGYIGFVCGTGMPADHYRASTWATWGTAVDLKKPSTWQRGDTIVMTRPGGSHVCLLDRVEGDRVFCLGGNQSNAVTIAPFPLSRITAVRR